jgi:urease accessory protein UreF
MSDSETEITSTDSEETVPWEWLARVLHFSDSALPVGAYAHSFGLEGVCQMGIVHDKETLKTFLHRDVVTALTHIELPLVAHAYQAAMDGKIEELKKLDQLSFALRPTRQLREAASRNRPTSMAARGLIATTSALNSPTSNRLLFWASSMLTKKHP